MPTLNLRKINGSAITEKSIAQLLPRGQSNLRTIQTTVQEIIDSVRENGDQAIKDYTTKFDGIDYSLLPVKVSEQEFKEARNQIKPELLKALELAKKNIEKFHSAQLREDWSISATEGVKTGQIYRPIEKVGLYIPGGTAVYPSSVLMEAIPATVAGVKKIILCSPPQKNGKIASAILVAAEICGVESVYRCGGAQAIAAMAYGTESVPSVHKIVGPGNKWVAAAKQLVSTQCGIDNPAGPSEILLVTDKTTNPTWAAHDLIAQSEHGPDNVSVLLCEDEEKITQILEELDRLVDISSRKEYLVDNLTKFGLVITSESFEDSVRLINLIATEHLHLNVEDPQQYFPLVQNAGAIFVGQYTTVPLGDYCAGTNHVLPTAGYARFYSGLSTSDFIKIIDVLEVSKVGVKNLFPILEQIASFEGLEGHIDCTRARLEEEEK